MGTRGDVFKLLIFYCNSKRFASETLGLKFSRTALSYSSYYCFSFFRSSSFLRSISLYALSSLLTYSWNWLWYLEKSYDMADWRPILSFFLFSTFSLTISLMRFECSRSSDLLIGAPLICAICSSCCLILRFSSCSISCPRFSSFLNRGIAGCPESNLFRGDPRWWFFMSSIACLCDSSRSYLIFCICSWSFRRLSSISSRSFSFCSASDLLTESW